MWDWGGDIQSSQDKHENLVLVAHLLVSFIQHQALLYPAQGDGGLNYSFLHIFRNGIIVVHRTTLWPGATKNYIRTWWDLSNVLQMQVFLTRIPLETGRSRI